MDQCKECQPRFGVRITKGVSICDGVIIGAGSCCNQGFRAKKSDFGGLLVQRSDLYRAVSYIRFIVILFSDSISFLNGVYASVLMRYHSFILILSDI